MLLKGGCIKISDFGFSKVSNSMCSLVSAVGTPIYRAPQVSLNISINDSIPYTYKCDIWSFGVICYELVTGKIPWTISEKSTGA